MLKTMAIIYLVLMTIATLCISKKSEAPLTNFREPLMNAQDNTTSTALNRSEAIAPTDSAPLAN